MPSRLMISDDPPALTNGSGMPLVGIIPSTTLMLTSACTAIMVVSPERDERTKRVGRLRRDAKTAPGDDAKANQDCAGADQSEFLGNHRVDEVRVRLRQVEQLLHTLHQPFARDASGAYRDERLNQLEAVAERIVPGVQECEHAAAAVVGADHDERRKRKEHEAGGQHVQ